MARPTRSARSGSHRYFSAAALSLVDATGVADPELAMAQVVGELLSEAGTAAPPVPLDLLASLRGVVAIDEVDMANAGALLPLPGSAFRIQVRAADPPGRRRFTIGHEIAHLLIPAYRDSPVTKVDGVTGEFGADDEEEYLCDLGASDLLLPESLFREECAARRPSLDGLFDVAELFGSSLESAAIRADHLLVWPCVPVVWEWSMKPSQQPPVGQAVLLDLDRDVPAEKEFRVKFPAGRMAGTYFPRHRHVPRDSAMIVACMEMGQHQGLTVIPVGHGLAERHVEARLVPYRGAAAVRGPAA
jgi:hypothetical protein